MAEIIAADAAKNEDFKNSMKYSDEQNARITSDKIVENELHNIIIEKLREHVQFFKIYIIGAIENKIFTENEIEFNFDNLSDIWHLQDVKGVNIFKGEQIVDQLNNAILKIRMTYRQIFHAIQYTIFSFNKYFHRSLTEKDNHQPHIGLLISFLKLYRYAQIELNEMTTRILYFYYNTVLKQVQRDGICDHVHLSFNISNHIKKFVLPSGTALSAGSSKDGSDISYETIRDIEITKANIKSLKSF